MRRSIIITIVTLATTVVVFLFLARHIEHQLAQRPYIAAVKGNLRAVSSAQLKHRATTASYASDVAHLPLDPDSALFRFVRVRIVASSADGFLAEGRHDLWPGRCVIAVGSFTGDSLAAGEARCYSP